MRKFKQPYFFNADPADPAVPGGGDPTPTDTPTDAPTESAWPDNWRQMYAGEDEKKLSQLSRYASPEAAFDGLIATKTKLSSGEYKSTSPYPEKGTEEEQNAWRENNGIPLKAEEYEFASTIPEEDKQYIEDFKEYAHEKNIPKNYANEFVDFLVSQEEKILADGEAEDETFRQESEDKLRVEWGADYRRNLNIINGLFDTAPEGVKDLIFNGRLADGKPIGSHPDVLRYFVDLALQINPVATVVGTSGGNVMSSIDDELEQINNTMKNEPSKYYKDEKMQARWRELTAAKERMAK